MRKKRNIALVVLKLQVQQQLYTSTATTSNTKHTHTWEERLPRSSKTTRGTCLSKCPLMDATGTEEEVNINRV